MYRLEVRQELVYRVKGEGEVKVKGKCWSDGEE